MQMTRTALFAIGLILPGIVLVAPRIGSADEPSAVLEGGTDGSDEEMRSAGATAAAGADADAEAVAPYETLVTGARPAGTQVPAHRAVSRVSRADMERRAPRSAPDALRYTPGVFVQQTAHGQGSAFIRGLTGQQTLLMFDGIRLNNSTYRQGPNQYFFTLDSETIESIEVLRGGASTRYGSDAIGGVVSAMPIEPLPPLDSHALVTLDPHLIFKARSADEEVGGRAATQITYGPSLSLYGGMGGRRVGLLHSGGPIMSPQTGEPPRVPRYADDNRTELGTGFFERTADLQAVYRLNPRYRIKTAAFLYQQHDSPRTDQCPSAYAPYDECLMYDQQYRYLVYGVVASEPSADGIAGFRTTLSWQRQQEHRTKSRPSSAVASMGRDVVDTLGVTLNWTSDERRPLPWLGLRMRYGIDTYYDTLDSAASITFTDVDITRKRSRGQYLNGSDYLYGGLYLEEETGFFDRLFLRGGGRFSWVAAHAPGDEESGSAPVDESWFPWVGEAGIEARLLRSLSLLVSFDRSFRAPNLDDLTSRQQTGPGFQFENPDLKPETADTFEVGLRTRGSVRWEIFAFRTLLEDAVVKSPRDVSDCPENAEGCASSWSRFQLVNADAPSEIRGVEGALEVETPSGIASRATIAWTFGEGPNMGDRPSAPSLPFKERVPLSRIPPLNGTVELFWSHLTGFSVGGMVRWAAPQDRLALSDISDERIPKGGTPGFAVLDLRAGYRQENLLSVSLVLENLCDTAYRYHGSSVDGPGRGLSLLVDLGPLWRW